MPSSQPITRHAFLHGAIASLPLSLAVAPWGLLAGSMAIEANLSPWQGQGLSAIVFAGAAQLVAIGMLNGGASLLAILYIIIRAARNTWWIWGSIVSIVFAALMVMVSAPVLPTRDSMLPSSVRVEAPPKVSLSAPAPSV